jgi:hypothetical protein
MSLALLAHGGPAGAIAEGAAVLVALALLSVFVWRSTRRKIDDYDPGRERPDDRRAE